MFVSSRSIEITNDFKNALLNPLASDSGLFCPKELKKISVSKDTTFKELALKIFNEFNSQIDEKDFLESLNAYDEFDNKEPFLINKLDDNLYVCELYHGKTRAFKDLALAPLARLMQSFNEKLLIICATSGDTGPATLSAFSECDNIKTVCIYPKGKTSHIQEKQMAGIDYKNSLVLAIDGNFDDAQSKLKELLNDEDFKQTIKDNKLILSAANSLNFGRIIYQLIYHYYLSLQFDEAINVVIPSGNFGNALACFYAKMMGANINKIKIVSNENTILYDFFTTGEYNLNNRDFKTTYSPAMDILKSSNLERLLFYFFKDEKTKQLYKDLEENKCFKLSADELSLLQEHFEAFKCSDMECLDNIKKYSNKTLLDPHTATTLNAIDNSLNVICATAEWSKFVPSISKALDIKLEELEGLEYLANKYNYKLNKYLLNAVKSNENYAKELKVNEIKNVILGWIK